MATYKTLREWKVIFTHPNDINGRNISVPVYARTITEARKNAKRNFKQDGYVSNARGWRILSIKSLQPNPQSFLSDPEGITIRLIKGSGEELKKLLSKSFKVSSTKIKRKKRK